MKLLRYSLLLLCTAPAFGQSPTPTPPPTADALWAQIQTMEKGPPSQSASPQEVMDLLKKITAAADQFPTLFPKDPRRWEAKLVSLQFGSELAQANSQQPDPVKLESELQLIADAPDAPKDAKAEARVNLIGLHVGDSGHDVLTPGNESEILSFLHDFPDNPNDAALQKMRYQSLQKTDPEKASKFLDTLLKDPNPAVVSMAQSQDQLRDLTKKPFELQFTATNGSKVDVSKLRGKVVLVDFWASWCPPCMEEVPDLVKTYQEFHGKGLEIVGISLDQDKGPMEGVTKSSGMVWPQYFDGKGWQNEIAARYGISAIPRMFLVNKKGMVVDPDVPLPPHNEIVKLIGE